MTLPVKILLSARDSGAVGNMIELHRLLSDDPAFEPRVIASGVASQKMAQVGLEHITFNISWGKDHIRGKENPELLLDKARYWLNQIQPDFIVTSLSSLGAGIDEALIYLAKVPVVTFQDFWGDVNDTLGKKADTYLVLDDFAAQLSEKRWQVNTRITGMPKYLPYGTIPFGELKKKTRNLLGLKEDTKLIGWFGQPPEVPGHQSAFETFMASCSRLSLDYALMVKAHPKDKNADGRVLERPRGTVLVDSAVVKETEALLAACDLVVTPFSLCGFDHAVMTSFSSDPLGSVLYLMPNEKIRGFARKFSGMEHFPMVENSGAGTFIQTDDPRQVAHEMARLLTVEEKRKYFLSCSNVICHFNYPAFKRFIVGKL